MMHEIMSVFRMARNVGRGWGKCKEGERGEGKQEAGTARVQEAGFRVQERPVKSPSFPRKRESMLARVSQTEHGSPLSRG
jgi:hypothetical protein